jgi:hypothetical protein
MQFNIKAKDPGTLLILYKQEVETLNARLLKGEPWEDLQAHRRNITTLSIALQKHGLYVNRINPAEFPQSESGNAEPVE